MTYDSRIIKTITRTCARGTRGLYEYARHTVICHWILLCLILVI